MNAAHVALHFTYLMSFMNCDIIIHTNGMCSVSTDLEFFYQFFSYFCDWTHDTIHCENLLSNCMGYETLNVFIVFFMLIPLPFLHCFSLNDVDERW